MDLFGEMNKLSADERLVIAKKILAKLSTEDQFKLIYYLTSAVPKLVETKFFVDWAVANEPLIAGLR